jgi:pyridoxamine 5'-phosphate oxidase family protein
MTKLTDKQIAYLESQLLGRIATVGLDGIPHVVPTTLNYNYELGTIDVGGHHVLQTKRFNDVKDTGWAAIVIDDLLLDPWRPRMLEIRGQALAMTSGGTNLGRIVEIGVKPNFGEAFIRIWPDKINSVGIDE